MNFVLFCSLQDSSFLVSSSIPIEVAAVELFGQVHYLALSDEWETLLWPGVVFWAI